LLATDLTIRTAQDGVFGSAARMNGISGENLKILIDGVPVMGRLNGGIDLGQMNLQSVKQVEIIDGAQSLMYGSNASAGVINIITTRSQSRAAEAGLQTNLESNGFRTHTARVGLQKSGLSFQASGTDLTFQPAADSIRNLLWNPKTQRSVRSSLRYSTSSALDLRMSGSMLNEVVDNLGEMRRPQYKPYAFDDIYRTNRADVNLHAQGWFGSQTYFWQATAGINDFKRVRNSYRYDADESISQLIEGQQDTSGARGILQRVTIATDHKNKSWDVLLGAERMVEVAEGIRFVDTLSEKKGKVSNSDLGIFGSVKWRLLPSLTVQGGARYTDNRTYGRVVTPSLWSSYAPDQKTIIKFTYANGFRSPGMKELYFQFIDVNHFISGNTSLKPERSHNLRLDATRKVYQKNQNALELQVNAFYNKVNNRISLVEVGPVRYTYLNITDYHNAGYGATLVAHLGDWFRFQTGAIHMAQYNDLYDNPALKTTPLNWSLDWSNDATVSLFKDKLRLHLWHKHTGKTVYFFSEDLIVKKGNAAGWSLLNASLSAPLWKNRIRLTGGVKNILNRRTLDSRISDGIHSPVAANTPIHWGRTLFLTAALDL
jgi:outer membrane receptor for ferrienterochelin and colicins